ncbi:short-subunit dehydrogenase [Antricoccus suffuscus]|uniref:Short-subunit dehydrogenase n=1 Tax=Antricoccus suffuscus TaxID=1629062 RepID=A0A2T0ZZ54_9ACTN|nr:SDR family oxidoreductase [Antricoccus suffuscus]PRZ41646.1 short-subunit dehydrogenase [Antricoccus suffuscus]
MPTALITGGSAGLGKALTADLAHDGWNVVIDGRDANRLHRVAHQIGPRVRAIPGDVTDPLHRADLATAVGDIDLLVNNASTIGSTPMPAVADIDGTVFDGIWLTNVAAPLALTQLLLPALRRSGGALVNVTSDAAVEHYERWGGYGASKAALDHLTLTLAVENPQLSIYAVDPGDMRTKMHQDAFPGEDIGDRPLPESVVPAIRALLARRPASGRYRAAEFAADASSVVSPEAVR